MSRTFEHTVYQFDELEDAAKKKAREWRTAHVFEDPQDWEHVYSDAVTIAALFGLEIDTRRGSTEPSIFFSGFWSQGDGACFEGDYAFKADALEAVKEHAPKDTELHDIVARIQAAQAPVFGAVGFKIAQRGHYSHSGCMDFESKDVDESLESELAKLASDAVRNAEVEIEFALRQFADWIYARLEAEYEWQTADEQVDDALRANEYEFEANGERA